MMAYYCFSSYYLLYGEKITAFPNNFRMLAGDPFQRNFTWPVPDPPKSSWTGAQQSQAALRQKALGFNCLNYAKAAEGSLQRHFLPDKAFLDEHCTDGLRLELMFPSCWNGKDLDSPDHKSHVAYPSLVMDGTCPEGYETRLVSLFYETIWDTYAFKDVDGYFALANGDPTGFGYHGDFMFGWEDGVLQQAVDTCTSETGLITDCKIFDIQTESDEHQCSLDLPSQLQHEDVYMHADGLPGSMPIEWGPAYAMPGMASTIPAAPTPVLPTPSPDIPPLSLPSLSLSLSVNIGNIFEHANILNNAGQPPTITPTPTISPSSVIPSPTTSLVVESLTEVVIYVKQEVVVMIDAEGVPYATHTGTRHTMSSATKTLTETSTLISHVERDNSNNLPGGFGDLSHLADHVRPHAHLKHGHSHHQRDVV